MANQHTKKEWNDWLLPEPMSGCLLWTGYVNKDGYGHLMSMGKTRYVHRIAYERKFGPILDGLTVDHLCKVTTCCNPSHMELVTSVENVRRGNSFSTINKAKTHCHRGHKFDSTNTYIQKNGRRSCKKCNAIAVAKYKGEE